jgi:hypothetical protein
MGRNAEAEAAFRDEMARFPETTDVRAAGAAARVEHRFARSSRHWKPWEGLAETGDPLAARVA